MFPNNLTKAEEIVGNCGSRKDEIEIQINKASLLIKSKDTSAREYVENYMNLIDTSLNRQEKIASVMGKKYLGDLEEERGFFRIALGHFLEVMESGVLNQVKEYRQGILKGISRAATELGDYDYALEKLDEVIINQEIYTHQYNNILIAKAINYYKKGEFDKISVLTEEILSNDNLTTQDKIETCWLRIKTNMMLESRDEVYMDLANIISLKSEVQDRRLLSRINLLEAEVCESYGTSQETNTLLERYNKLGGGSKEQNLKADRLWLTNNITGVHGQRLERYLDAVNSATKEKSSAEMHEMMAIYKVEQEMNRSALLLDNLGKEQEISSQRTKAMSFFGLSTILALLLWILSLRNTKIQKQLNEMLQVDKRRLSQERSKLESDKEKLVFDNQDLINMNQCLIDQKQSANQNKKIRVETRDKIHFIELASILYLKAEKEGTKLKLVDEKSIWCQSPLKYFVENLSESGFVRIHRAVTVNLNNIDWINHSTLKMNNGEELRVSRTYKETIIKLLKRSSPS